MTVGVGRRRARLRHPAVVLAVVLPVLLAPVAVACGGTEPTRPPAPADGIVVASFNFPESRLMAEIYAQALEDEGVRVRRELDLGPRELVVPALRQGLVDLVPEYLGSALATAVPGAAVDWSDPAAVSRGLADAVAPWGLRIRPYADAQNQNGLVVTRAIATRHDIDAVSDLAPLASTLTIGGPPECRSRPNCLVGLADTYSLEFRAFVPLARGSYVSRALEDGVVDVGVLFTTDGALAGDEFVLLDDDRGLQPAENLVPLVRSEALEGEGGRVAAALDEVSARLTTENLRFLNWRIAVAGSDPADEARGWLIRQGLVAREPAGGS